MRCTTGRGQLQLRSSLLPYWAQAQVASPRSPVLSGRCLDYILEEIKHSRKASVMVASHNEDTVKFTLHRWVLGGSVVWQRLGGLEEREGPAWLWGGVLGLVRSPLCLPSGILAPFWCSGLGHSVVAHSSC